MIVQHVRTWVRMGKLLFFVATLSSCGGSASLDNIPTLATLTVTLNTNNTVAITSMAQAKATGTYSDGSTRDITSVVNWSSNNTAIATVNSAGQVVGVAMGTAIITATIGAFSNSNTISSIHTWRVTTLASIDGTVSTRSFTTDGTSLYVTDSANRKIYRIVIATGVVTTLAGSGANGAVDAAGTAASFGDPKGITTDGTSLYVADFSNRTIRKIVIATGAVTTLAGSGARGAVDATGTAASFSNPTGITTDGTSLYVTDSSNIRKIVIATGVVTTLAVVDATGNAAWLNGVGITTDGGSLYVTDSNNIRKIVIATGVVTTLAGSGFNGAVDATGTAASFSNPKGITTDGTNLYVADTGNWNIRKIVIATGVVTTLAGSGSNGVVDATGTAASFWYPTDITTDGTSLYVIDTINFRKID